MRKRKWQTFEDEIAKSFEGKKTRGSGNQWYNPSDIKTGTYLIEAKQTTKGSYSLSKKTWTKTYEAALFSYRTPLMALNIQGIELIVMAKKDFLEIQKKLATDSD